MKEVAQLFGNAAMNTQQVVTPALMQQMMSMIPENAEKKKDSDTAIKSVIDSVIEVFKTSDKSAAEEAGKNFVQGFANGITNKLVNAK